MTQEVAQHFAENAAITMLVEGESKRMYQRKRMAQSFHAPEIPPPTKRCKSHSPDFGKVSWDKKKSLNAHCEAGLVIPPSIGQQLGKSMEYQVAMQGRLSRNLLSCTTFSSPPQKGSLLRGHARKSYQ